MFNYVRSRRVVNQQLRKWGGREALRARLVRDGAERRCVAARLEYTPKERGLFLDGSSRILIAGDSVTEPPHHEHDIILFAGEYYRMPVPVVGYRQGNDTVLYYDCNVVRTDPPSTEES